MRKRNLRVAPLRKAGLLVAVAVSVGAVIPSVRATPAAGSGTEATNLLDGAAARATQAVDELTALRRVDRLKAEVSTFHLLLWYHGEQDKPFYLLNLSVPPLPPVKQPVPAYLGLQISEKEAGKIIEHLMTSGFIGRAEEGGARRPPRDPGPCYAITVEVGSQETGFLELTEHLGWQTGMLKRLDALRAVLKGDAAARMDTLLGRLSGLRAAWEKQPPAAVR